MLEGALSKTQLHPILDLHTLTVLWLINSGCNVEECLLEGNEMAGVNFGAFLPTDQKVLRLLLEAGAVEQHDVAGCDYESQVSFSEQFFCNRSSNFKLRKLPFIAER